MQILRSLALIRPTMRILEVLIKLARGFFHFFKTGPSQFGRLCFSDLQVPLSKSDSRLECIADLAAIPTARAVLFRFSVLRLGEIHDFVFLKFDMFDVLVCTS